VKGWLGICVLSGGGERRVPHFADSVRNDNVERVRIEVGKCFLAGGGETQEHRQECLCYGRNPGAGPSRLRVNRVPALPGLSCADMGRSNAAPLRKRGVPHFADCVRNDDGGSGFAFSLGKAPLERTASEGGPYNGRRKAAGLADSPCATGEGSRGGTFASFLVCFVYLLDCRSCYEVAACRP
jgi:hypothetical protein